MHFELAIPSHPDSLDRRRIVDLWLESKSPNTRRSYRRSIADFAEFLTKTINDACEDLINHGSSHAQQIVLAYRTHLVSRGLAAATIASRLAAIRSIVQLARLLGSISWSIEIPSIRTEGYRDTRGPGKDGWRSILAAVATEADPAIRARNTAILRLLHDLALRRFEVASIDLSDVDFVARRLRIVGKGKTESTYLTIPHATMKSIEDWLTIRGREDGPMFVRLDRGCTLKNLSRITTQAIYNLVKKIGEKAKLDRPLRPHGLRHQAITSALESTNGDVRRVAKFSRHAKIETVLVYDDNRRDDAGTIAEQVSIDNIP